MKKFIKRFFKGLFLILFAIIAGFSLYAVISGKTYLFKAVYYNFAGIDDYKIFSNDTVAVAAAQPWPVSGNFNKIRPNDELNRLLEKINTVAVVVIKNDSLLYEQYWDGYSDSSLSGSFSMAKS